MPSYTGTSDSTFKEKKFVLKKLRHHYENVLLFGDIKKLRDTAEELIKNYTPKKNQVNGRIDKETFKNTNGKNVDASFYEQKIEPFLKKKQLGIDKKLEINKKLEIDNELDIDNEKRKEKEIKINKEKDIIKKGNVITKNSQEDVGVGTGVNVDMDVNIDSSSPLIKKTSFWQIYSMRVKKSAHLLNHFDFALILHSFHLHNKDTGIYSSCVKYVEKEIPKMNGVSYVLLLNILSTRLKKNSYNFFFEKMRQNIPNILFDLNLKDIINILNCFYNIELHHKSICDIISKKVLNNLQKTDTDTLSSLCYIFYQYDFDKKYFFESLKNRGIYLINHFNAKQFYKFVFPLHKKQICLKEIVEKKKNDISFFLSEYNQEQKMFICDIFDIQ